VERISKEMEKVKEQVGFKGDLKAFLDHVRNDKKLMPFKTGEEIIAYYNAIHSKMKPNLTKLFAKAPKASFEVRRIESFVKRQLLQTIMQDQKTVLAQECFIFPHLSQQNIALLEQKIYFFMRRFRVTTIKSC